MADPAEISFVFNTLLFCIGGFLVMWMAAGFTMLEAGLVRGKNTVVICIKNLGLFSIAGLAYYLIGYNLMYAGVDGGYFGSISIWSMSRQLRRFNRSRLFTSIRLVFPNGFCCNCSVHSFCIGRKNINLSFFCLCNNTNCNSVSYFRFMAVGWRLAK